MLIQDNRTKDKVKIMKWCNIPRKLSPGIQPDKLTVVALSVGNGSVTR